MNLSLLNNYTESITRRGPSVEMATTKLLNPELSDALIPLTVFFGVLSIIGAVGNSLVLFVFTVSKEYQDSNFRVFVLSFGLVDLITCLLFLPMEFVKNHVHSFYDTQSTCKVKCFFNVLGLIYAALLLLLISVERYRKVCHPLRSQLWPSMAFRLIGVVVCLTVMLSIPAPIMCGITEIVREVPVNVSHVARNVLLVCKTDEAYVHSKWRTAYKFLLTICLLVISVSVITMYTLIGRVIRRQTRPCRTSFNVRRTSITESDVFIEGPVQNNGNVCSIEDEEQRQSLSGEAVATNSPITKINDNTQSQCVRKDNTSLRKQVIIKQASVQHNSAKRSSVKKISQRQRRRRLSSYSGPGGFPYKTIIWLVLTILFLVTYAINAAVSFLDPSSFPNKYVLYNFLLRLYFVNSVANPVVYALLDQRFRRSCSRLMLGVKDKLLTCCTLSQKE